MRRRNFLYAIGSLTLAGCLGGYSHSKRIGPQHWINDTDGYVSLVWGYGGRPVCGIDYYSREGERISLVSLLEYGKTGKWIIVKTNLGYHSVPQNEDGHSAGPPMTAVELQDFLSKNDLKMPKMKAI